MKPKYDTELLAIFKSTPQDLETNRSGFISKRQMKRLKKEFSVDMKREIAIGCILMVTIFLYIDGMYNSSLRYGDFRLLVDALIIFCIILGLFSPSRLSLFTWP